MSSAAHVDAPLEQSSPGRSLWPARLILLGAAAALAAVVWWTRERPPVPVAETFRNTALEAVGVRQIVLGEPGLFAGIPGSEKLTDADIQKWLDDPRVHEPLDLKPPLWMPRAAVATAVSADDPLTLAKIELGRQLFMERRFVQRDGFSCVECHLPSAGFSRASVFTKNKNPPPSFNRILSTHQFWDGHAASLEAQVFFPLTHEEEMNSSTELCEKTLLSLPGYRQQFERIYGEVSYDNAARAIAAFERALVTGSSAYDYHRVLRELESRDVATLTRDERRDLEEARAGSQRRPMSEAALRGEQLFFSDRTGCANCHDGPNFTDEKFHNLGVGFGKTMLGDEETFARHGLGRFDVTKNESDRGAFKTPTLRNLRATSPYFHDGSVASLEDAVAFVAGGGKPNPHLSPLMQDAELSRNELRDLVAFLEALEGDLPEVPTDRLPP